MDGMSAVLVDAATRQLIAARYAFHKVTVFRYAIGVMNGGMTLEQARDAYRKAMANYDGIIASAVVGAQDMNQAEMAKGSTAIDEALKAAGHG
jgi:hypothetical protein